MGGRRSTRPGSSRWIRCHKLTWLKKGLASGNEGIGLS
jgi:hypothetical protein